jgi:hypothetical protein
MQATIVFQAHRSPIHSETQLERATNAHLVTIVLRAPQRLFHVNQDFSKLDKVLSNARSVLQDTIVKAELLTRSNAFLATALLAQLIRRNAKMERMRMHRLKSLQTQAAARLVQMQSGALRE